MLRTLSFVVLSLMAGRAAFAGDGFTPPTPAELSMTSIPEVPGAPAVYLFREETTDDTTHTLTFYTRLKVLTEAGKEYANVELPFYGGSYGYTVDNIVGRTIQPDGSIVTFTGKPYEKLIVKTEDFQRKAKVFTLPAVDIGSIIEYRYRFHFDNTVNNPDWYLQSALFTRKAHYMWRPTTHDLVDSKGNAISNNVAWTPILPPGVKVVETQRGGSTINGSGGTQLDLDVKDIPPLPHAYMMPPINSVSYRVLFYYTAYRTLQDYWKNEGKSWSREHDKFIGPGSGVTAAATALVAPGDTQDQKLRKIYARVMTLDNTDFSRRRTASEEQAAGLKPVSNSDDVLHRERGNGDQLAMLFVGMARAAGFKAYAMGIADRRNRLFLPQFLSTRQLEDIIAIVVVDGKDVYFDPGQRYCGYGHLAWFHAPSNGLRQTEAGVELASTPSESYKDEHASRIADLTIDEDGKVTGTVTLNYTGDLAMDWRQRALRGDDTSLNSGFRRHLEGMLPAGMDVRVTDVKGIADFDKPLIITYTVKGGIGSSTGKRLLVPANLFESSAKARFTSKTREVAVDLHHTSYVQDAVRIKYPVSLTVESAPSAGNEVLKNIALFTTSSKPAPNAITLFRNVTIGRILFSPEEYPDLHAFYGKLEAKDQETLVLTRAAAATAAPAGN